MTTNNKKGLTLSIVFEGSDLNYSEGLGNGSSLKKLTKDNESYTYISPQALKYEMKRQMDIYNTPLSLDSNSDSNDGEEEETKSKKKSVIQYDYDTNIQDYAEIDLFGYMKTKKKNGSKKRSGVVRVTNGISLSSFKNDLDFLTNMGLVERANSQGLDLKGGSIANSEIHHSLYAYTIAIELDQLGIDVNDNIEISNEEKAHRVNELLDTINSLYRNIKGKTNDLSPIFVVGGVYTRKNPYFDNKIKINNNKVDVSLIKSVINRNEDTKTNTKVATLDNFFVNDEEIKKELGAIEICDFFEDLKAQVKEVYGI